MVAYESLKTKEKSQVKRGFKKVVVTRAGRLREWLQGELLLRMWALTSLLNSKGEETDWLFIHTNLLLIYFFAWTSLVYVYFSVM